MAALGKKLRTLEGGRVAFWCPGCFRAHQITVSREAAPDGPCWGFDGNVERPTFTPSIFVNRPGPSFNPGAPSCHSFVTNGRILFLQDCTHQSAGQTVDLPDWPDFPDWWT
jgi:hypothetical protein